MLHKRRKLLLNQAFKLRVGGVSWKVKDSAKNLPSVALHDVASMNSKIIKTSTKFRLAAANEGLNDILCELIDDSLVEAKDVIKEHSNILGDYWGIERLKLEVSELEVEYNYLKKIFLSSNRFFYKNDYD